MVKKIRRKKKVKSSFNKPPEVPDIQKPVKHFALSEVDSTKNLTVGSPFKTLALGQVSSRLSGDQVGSEITIELLNELVRVFYERKEVDPVIIGLYASPKYTEKGIEIIEQSQGLLWSSPEYLQGEVFSRDGGEKIGEAMLLAITLTPRPAQQVNKIETVKLKEDSLMDLSSLPDEVKDLLASKDEIIRELEAKLQDAMSNEAAKVTPEVAEKIVEEVVDEVSVLAEDEDKKEEEEDKKEAMSEMLTERASQVELLREHNLLKEQFNQVLKERHIEKRTQAIESLVQSGRINPSEIKPAKVAYDLKDKDSTIWNMFKERALNQAVPLDKIGHGSKAAVTSTSTLNEKVKLLSEEKGITFFQALDEYRIDNPTEYNRAYGVK
jgi:hypothetical protein